MSRVIVLFIAVFSLQFAWADHSNLISKRSANSVSVTIDKLETVLKKKGITIFARIDPQKADPSSALDMIFLP